MIFENKKYLSFSHDLADLAGKILIKNYKSKKIIKIMKTNSIRNELVTNVDVMIEKKIRKHITSKFPSHNILGEEDGLTDKKSSFTWIMITKFSFC